jgi:ferredoxin-NADP reductase
MSNDKEVRAIEGSAISAPTVSHARQRPSHRARVERISDHCADLRSLFLRTTEGALPRFLPGMFISVAIPLAGETRVRPYTIASSPEDGQPFEICFNRVPNGPGSAWLFDLAVGAELNFTGPFGTFTLDHAPAADAESVFIADETAVAPIRPMIRRAIATSTSTQSLTLVHAAYRPDHLLYSVELARLAAAHARFTYEPMIISGDDPSTLYSQLSDEVRRRWVDADANRSRHFYICGVGKGVIALRDLLRGAGYERRAVHYEQW